MRMHFKSCYSLPSSLHNISSRITLRRSPFHDDGMTCVLCRDFSEPQHLFSPLVCNFPSRWIVVQLLRREGGGGEDKVVKVFRMFLSFKPYPLEWDRHSVDMWIWLHLINKRFETFKLSCGEGVVGVESFNGWLHEVTFNDSLFTLQNRGGFLWSFLRVICSTPDWRSYFPPRLPSNCFTVFTDTFPSTKLSLLLLFLTLNHHWVADFVCKIHRIKKLSLHPCWKLIATETIRNTSSVLKFPPTSVICLFGYQSD